MFGTELVKGKIYDFFTGAKIAIFTYQGCTISVRGETDVIYVAKETPMVCNNTLQSIAPDFESTILYYRFNI